MAVVALSHNVTRQEDFEGTPGGTIGSTGGGPGAGAAAGLQYEATQALQRRIASADTDHGFDYAHDDIGTVNMYNAGFHVWLLKIYSTILDVNAAGIEAGIGDADGSMYRAQIGDDGTMGDDRDFAAPAQGGYIILPWEPRVNAWHSEGRETTPDISVADTVEAIYNVGSTTGAGDSSAMDSIDYSTDGLFLVGGDSTDPDGVFQDFVDADQGAGLTGASRAGIWTSNAAGIVAYLTNYIGRTDAGTTTATVFTDEGFTVVFPGGLLSDGRNGLFFDLGNASTVVTLSDGTIKGSDRRYGGRSKIKRYFDTEFDVNATTDRITIPGHGFRTGDAVIYSAEGGTEDIGPDATNGEARYNTAGTIGTGAYWYVVAFSVDEISLHADAQDAYSAAPTNEALTASTAGNGELHSLERDPDTRPNLEFSGVAGTATFTRVAMTLTRIITMTSAVTFEQCTIGQGRKLILSGAGATAGGTLDACIIAGPTTSLGEAYLECEHASHLDVIDGSTFISGGLGHAIEVTTDGTVAEDQAALQDVTFTGYWTGDEDNTGGVSFEANTGVASNQITFNANHNMTTRDAFYYSDEGGTAITGLTDQGLYFVEVVDADTVYVHATPESATQGASGNRISLTAGGAETHKFYSANAALYNSTGTALTINVNGGNSPTVRNSAGSTTTVVNTVTLTINVEDQAGAAIQNARVAIYEGTDPDNLGAELMNELTTAGGVATESYVFSTDQPITVRVRKSSSADNPRYFPFVTTGTIDSNGFTTTAVLIVDPIAG